MKPDQHPTQQAFPLSMADEGKSFKIVLLNGGKSIGKRLSSLGLNINCELEIVNRQGASLVVGRDQTRFALGLGMARQIMVIPV